MVPRAGDSTAFDSAMLGCSCVLRLQDKWHIYYSAGVESGSPLAGETIPGFPMRAGLATSTDGVNWERVHGSGAGGSIMDVGAEGQHDEAYIGELSLLVSAWLLCDCYCAPLLLPSAAHSQEGWREILSALQ